ncbi:glycoside hydrolase family 32 protein [Agromyces sp. ISL-38]|uniref:glycoside hydrolase family 32 protein n=1 Tax=Agromyces sp. ISL-38 TaxID=2819107 RepID=UPI001BEADC1D|nr:glycoside hydrolase family 32 protein [Agromyces sp. ISL-38]MBT2497655.1 glycoside hydrolase family 32 protein [Agromyces sp. ISL-38]
MRPEFHFTANGWINDPHAITFARGRCHLFFQHVPGVTEWNPACSWGHASGNDLFSLRQLPPALSPGDGDAGVWSGSLMTDAEGNTRILYTSVAGHDPAIGRIRSATPADEDWVTWVKGPVVASAPLSDQRVLMYRDPMIVQDGDHWRMLVGAGLADGVAAVVGYSSSDGVEWNEDGIVLARPASEQHPVWTGSMWECPQIVEVNGRHALIISVWDSNVLYDVVYALGDYADGVFSPQSWARLSYGPSPYAATVFRDAEDRPCLMFWLRDVSGDGWAGAHSIPYRITITDEVLALEPHPDLTQYYGPAQPGGIASDITWPTRADDVVKIIRDGAVVLKLERDSQDLVVTLTDASYRVPWAGSIRVVVDGPVLEISSAAGTFASPIHPFGSEWDIEGAGVSARRLETQALA